MIHFSGLDYVCAFSENIKYAEITSYLAGSNVFRVKNFPIDPLLFLVGPRSSKTRSQNLATFITCGFYS